MILALFNSQPLGFIPGPYEMGGVAMCHKKVGNEEGTKRARANLKDVHWCVTFVYCKLRLMSPTPHCWMLHVRPFTHHGTLLRVVRSCCANLETGLTFESTTPNISFVP